MQAGAKLRDPLRDSQHSGPQRFHSGNLALLSRSNTHQASSSKLAFAADKGGDSKGTKMAALTRGASFRRQGSSGMTWTENWTFTDDGMFSRNTKVSDEKSAMASSSRPGQDPKSAGPEITSGFPAELQRSLSVGSGTRNKRVGLHHKWGIKWIKKSFRKAFK
ncbi:hypothetical protein Mapa_014764 [Marchantia paleacea]|nr:hypothetical protein Mapa_014764 [Marchantia paleacea]